MPILLAKDNQEIGQVKEIKAGRNMKETSRK